MPLGILALVATYNSLGWAQSPSPESDPSEPVLSRDVVHERRGGLTVGYSTGLWLGHVEGTPAEEDKIGSEEARSSSSGVGAGSVLWLGATITDWFGVALGLGGGALERRGKVTAISSLHFRLEGYPLYARGGWYRDLGLTLVSGLGFAIVEGEEEDEPRVAGLGASTVGLGVFHETFGFWKFRAGPSLEYAYSFSRPAVAHSALLGARLVFRLEP